MRLAFANQKGGVGKTTTAVTIGGCLAAEGRRVLLVDLDPQGNAATCLGIAKNSLVTTVSDVLLERCPVEDAVIQSGRPGLECLRSTPIWRATPWRWPIDLSAKPASGRSWRRSTAGMTIS